MAKWKLIMQRERESGRLIALDPDKNLIRREFGNNELYELPIIASRMISEIRPKHPYAPFDLLLGISPESQLLPQGEEASKLLLTTAGFSELAKIAFKGESKMNSYYSQIIEVDEYIDENGKVVKSPAESNINTVLRKVYNSEAKVIQVIFANSYRNKLHEKIFINLLQTAGYKHVFGSCE